MSKKDHNQDTLQSINININNDERAQSTIDCTENNHINFTIGQSLQKIKNHIYIFKDKLYLNINKIKEGIAPFDIPHNSLLPKFVDLNVANIDCDEEEHCDVSDNSEDSKVTLNIKKCDIFDQSPSCSEFHKEESSQSYSQSLINSYSSDPISDILNFFNEYGERFDHKSDVVKEHNIDPPVYFSPELISSTYPHLIGAIYSCLDIEKIEPVDYNNIWTSRKIAFFKSRLMKNVFPLYYGKKQSNSTFVNHQLFYKILVILKIKVNEMIIYITNERESFLNQRESKYYSPYDILPIDFRLWILTVFSRSFECCEEIFRWGLNPIDAQIKSFGLKDVLCDPKLIKYMGDNKVLFEQSCEAFKNTKDDPILFDTVFWPLFTLDYYLANEYGSVNVLMSVIEEDYDIDQIDMYDFNQIRPYDEECPKSNTFKEYSATIRKEEEKKELDWGGSQIVFTDF